MPTPLHLSDDEMNLLLVLAAPIDQRLRPEFLAAVAAELEANGQAGAVGIAIGWRARCNGAFSIRPSCPTPRLASATRVMKTPRSDHRGFPKTARLIPERAFRF
jgi:hypothetical protein